MSLGKEELLRKLISTSEGRRKIGMAMGDYIRDRLRRPSALSGLVVTCCSKCLMPEDEFIDGEHSEDECTVYRVMES